MLICICHIGIYREWLVQNPTYADSYMGMYRHLRTPETKTITATKRHGKYSKIIQRTFNVLWMTFEHGIVIVIVILPTGGPDMEHVGGPCYVHASSVRYGR